MAQHLSESQVRESVLKLLREMTGSLTATDSVKKMIAQGILVDTIVERLNDCKLTGTIGPSFTRKYLYKILDL